MMNTKPLWLIATLLLCVGLIRSQDDDVGGSKEARELINKANQLLKSRKNLIWGDGLGPITIEPNRAVDALDEAKVGVVAKFILIKAGGFIMGSPMSEQGRYPCDESLHSVMLTKNYEMQATEVTQLQYFLVMGYNPSVYQKKANCDDKNYRWVKFKKDMGGGQKQLLHDLCINHPVENISWPDARGFIDRLNKMQNKYKYRLPTEAEWEYAARTGTAGPYSFDLSAIADHAWYWDNSSNRTHAVASKLPNSWGLYDMNGNVAEWVEDSWYKYPGTDSKCPDDAGMGFRGGSFRDRENKLRNAYRRFTGVGPIDRLDDIGFRLVRERQN